MKSASVCHGDYDAQVSQRPIEVHELEHMAATDRGIIMLRNLARAGIHTVRDGGDPPGIPYQGQDDTGGANLRG